MAAAHVPVEELELFKRFVEVADDIWRDVHKWPPLERDTVGKQLIRAIDSVGANLVEGDGRHGTADALHFFVIARASARETRYWIERANARVLIDTALATRLLDQVNYATRQLNNLIRHRRTAGTNNHVHEDALDYEA